MPAAFTESAYENAVIELFRNMGYRHLYGPDIDRDHRSPFYEPDLDAALHRLNPALPEAAITEALDKLRHFENASLTRQNEVFTDYLQNKTAFRRAGTKTARSAPASSIWLTTRTRTTTPLRSPTSGPLGTLQNSR